MFGNPYQAIYNPYMAVYGAPYGASDSRHKKYKKMLHLMAKLIRTRKKLSRTGNASKQKRLHAEIKMMRKHIAKLRADLQNDGVDTSSAEAEATAQEAMTPDDGSSDTDSDPITGSTTMRKRHRKHRIRRMGSQRHRIRRMGSSRMMKPKGHVARRVLRPKRHRRTMHPKGTQGQTGVRSSSVRHHAYALRKRRARGIRGAYSQHRARLPGQRQFDGRRRQGPISASEVQQAPIAADADANDDGMLDNALAMDPNVMPTMETTDIPDVDFETEAAASDGILESAADGVDDALSGVLDFVEGFTGGNRGLAYGAVGALGGYLAAKYGIGKKHASAAILAGAVGGYFFGRNR